MSALDPQDMQALLARTARTVLDHSDGPSAAAFEVELRRGHARHVYAPDPALSPPLNLLERAALEAPGQHSDFWPRACLTPLEARIVLLLAGSPLPAKQIAGKLKPATSASKLRIVVAALRQRGVLVPTPAGLTVPDPRFVAAARLVQESPAAGAEGRRPGPPASA